MNEKRTNGKYKEHVEDHISKIYVNYKIAEIAVEALEEIRKTQGKVCNNFETCEHKECKSSYASWEIANRSLNEIEALLNNKSKCKCKGSDKCQSH